MKTFFSKDSVLKVVSLIIAILIWFYIIIVVDPSVDVTIRDIPVKYVNQDVLSDSGLCLVNDQTAKVELKIRGSRKKIVNIDNKNVYATVDVSNISRTGTFSLPIGLSIPYEYSEIVSKKPYNAEVVVDKKESKDVEISIVKSGSVANGYIGGEARTEDSGVKLTGAKSLLDNIGGAAVRFDYDDRAANINDTAKLYMLDRNGKIIEEDNYLYDMVEMDITETKISCPVYKLKNVPVKLNIADGVDLRNYKVSIQPSNVSVYGENEILGEVSEIFTGQFNIDEIAEEGTGTVKLVIPEGIKMRDAVTEVTVKAERRG